MKSLFILLSIILTLKIFSSQEVQKTLLINTNLTKEQLYQILSCGNNGNNNTSIEEVQTEAISDNETIIKNGKVKIKIKLEFDLNENEKKAFIQTITPIKEEEKITLINCFLAMAVCIILIKCFSLSLKMKRNSKLIMNKSNNRKTYLLKDD